MTDLSTTYLGIKVRNPIVVAACSLSGKVDRVKTLEEAGAGALVIKSLFEEQILHEMGELESVLETGGESSAESISYFPHVQHAGAREHLMWVERLRKEVKLPLIASLNAVTPGGWASYAKQLADAGVEGLELNIYAVQSDLGRSAQAVEAQVIECFQSVRAVTKLPIAVKLSPFYTCMGNLVQRLEAAGANGVVLFNRFLQPDIDPQREKLQRRMVWSTPAEMLLPLRWVALLRGRVQLDLIGNTGVDTGEDVARYLLAGASGVQVASCLYRHGLGHMAALTKGLADWMKGRGYKTVAEFRGNVSQQKHQGNTSLFERAQYMDFLLGQHQSA